MLNKKGIAAFSTAIWMLRLLFVAVVFFSIYFFTNIYSRIDVNEFNVEPDIFVQNMLYSPHGISYYDPISNRIYPGIIDLSNADVIDKINYSKHTGADIKIKDFDGNILFEKTINRKTYMRRVEGLPGAGGFDSRKKEIYVLVKDKGKLIPAKMEVEIVVQRNV